MVDALYPAGSALQPSSAERRGHKGCWVHAVLALYHGNGRRPSPVGGSRGLSPSGAPAMSPWAVARDPRPELPRSASWWRGFCVRAPGVLVQLSWEVFVALLSQWCPPQGLVRECPPSSVFWES